MKNKKYSIFSHAAIDASLRENRVAAVRCYVGKEETVRTATLASPSSKVQQENRFFAALETEAYGLQLPDVGLSADGATSIWGCFHSVW